MRYALAEVKAVEGESPNGEFEVVLSMPTLDRDDEVIDVKAFDPLPESIPFHAFHDFAQPIGRAVPVYDGDRLVARGYYASTPDAQVIRAKVSEGIIGHTSVGFMTPKREVKDGKAHIVKAELLEGSFVSVPSNREAAVLAAKSFQPKQESDRKTLAGSLEERHAFILDAVRAAHPDSWWTLVLATFNDSVVYEVETGDGTTQYQASYEIADGAVTLGAAEVVEVTEIIRAASIDPEKAAAPAAASPAEVPMARLAAFRAEADFLLID